jgi:hypothetical protein
MTTTGSFSVWIFFTDGTHFSEWRNLSGRTAVLKAKELSKRPVVQSGMVERIIITDSGDCTAFEYRPGVGVTYPGRTQSDLWMNQTRE